MKSYVFWLVLAACTALAGPAVAQGGDRALTPEQQARNERAVKANALTDSGFELLESGKVPAAAAAFRRAAETSGDCPRAWLGLAFAYTRQGRLPEAITAYRQVIMQVPGYRQYRVTVHLPAELEFARLLNRVGQRQEALEVYRQYMLYGVFGDAASEPVPLALLLSDHEPAGEVPAEGIECAADIALGIYRMEHRLSWDPYWSAHPVSTPTAIATNDAAAVEYFRLAVKAQPDSGIAQFYLGYALTRFGGSKTEAAAALDKALKFGTPEIKAAVEQLRATGKVTPPKPSGNELRQQIRIRTRGPFP